MYRRRLCTKKHAHTTSHTHKAGIHSMKAEHTHKPQTSIHTLGERCNLGAVLLIVFLFLQLTHELDLNTLCDECYYSFWFVIHDLYFSP